MSEPAGERVVAVLGVALVEYVLAAVLVRVDVERDLGAQHSPQVEHHTAGHDQLVRHRSNGERGAGADGRLGNAQLAVAFGLWQTRDGGQERIGRRGRLAAAAQTARAPNQKRPGELLDLEANEYVGVVVAHGLDHLSKHMLLLVHIGDGQLASNTWTSRRAGQVEEALVRERASLLVADEQMGAKGRLVEHALAGGRLLVDGVDDEADRVVLRVGRERAARVHVHLEAHERQVARGLARVALEYLLLLALDELGGAR